MLADGERHDGVGSLVYVVDDDDTIRAAVASLLQRAGLSVQCFASASAFLGRPPSSMPACLILELHLPEGSGLDVQRELVDRDPIPIVFLTRHADIRTSVRAMKAGAVEFLTKPFRDVDLIVAVQQALAQARADWRRQKSLAILQARWAALTPRERQVLCLVVTGMLNKQVASALGISVVTVKGHRRQVMEKLRANSVADLVRMAGMLGLS